jgi:hypothetical protein
MPKARNTHAETPQVIVRMSQSRCMFGYGFTSTICQITVSTLNRENDHQQTVGERHNLKSPVFMLVVRSGLTL